MVHRPGFEIRFRRKRLPLTSQLSPVLRRSDAGRSGGAERTVSRLPCLDLTPDQGGYLRHVCAHNYFGAMDNGEFVLGKMNLMRIPFLDRHTHLVRRAARRDELLALEHGRVLGNRRTDPNHPLLVLWILLGKTMLGSHEPRHFIREDDCSVKEPTTQSGNLTLRATAALTSWTASH